MNRAELRERRRKMAEECRNGSMLREVADRFGVTTHTVHRACHEHGVTYSGSRTSHESFRILKRMLDGERQSDVALEFNVSRQRVSQIALDAREAGFDV